MLCSLLHPTKKHFNRLIRDILVFPCTLVDTMADSSQLTRGGSGVKPWTHNCSPVLQQKRLLTAPGVCLCVHLDGWEQIPSIALLDHTSFPFLFQIIISMRAFRLCCHSRWCYSLLYASYEGNMSQSILLIILDDTWRSKATGQGERKGRKVHKGLTSTCEVRRCAERKEYKEKASFLQNTCFYLFSVTEGSKKQGETWYFMAVQTPLEPPTFLLSLPVFLN